MTSKTILGFGRFTAAVVPLLLCMSANAAAQEPTVTTLHTFTGDAGEGVNPSVGARLVEGRDGSFYGVTQSGGASGFGTIFRMTSDGATTTLHSFTEGPQNAYRALVEGRDGNLYGTVSHGGSLGLGTVFRQTPVGTFTVVHTFTGSPDGAYPNSELLEATDGYFYGTTAGGGIANQGTIFKISLDGTLTTLHSFTVTEGAGPEGITQGADGQFYGTTTYGGDTGSGTFFRMTPQGVVTHLHSFTVNDPSGRLVLGVDGNFYGTTMFSIHGGSESGTIFRITPSGTFTVISVFTDSSSGGGRPTSALLQASDLYLYGTSAKICFLCDRDTYYFRMDLEGHVEFLTRFAHGLSTTGYLNALIEARDGNLYGTWQGASQTAPNAGAVVRISNYTNCNDKLTVRYEEGTLHLGFTLMTKTPATFRTWLAVPGPPVRVGQVWSLPIPAIEPALFANLPVPGFPDIGKFFVLTALSTEDGAVCADWKLLDTGAAAAAHEEKR